MIKTILVPTSGSPTDESVFATALALAKALGSHLEFHHVRPSSAEAAARTPHLDFCVGRALHEALEAARRRESDLAASAAAHFETFCRENAVEIRSSPSASSPRTHDTVSASWREEADYAAERLLQRARYCDLVVLGRPQHRDYMPVMLLEDLLTGCGRPCVIAPRSAPRSVTGTIVVGWKETKEAARALAAAHPLLERAARVVLLSIAEREAASTAARTALEQLAQELKWHGIEAEIRLIDDHKGSVTSQLARAAHELSADLLVVGGFGHGPLRELIFGGVTQSLIDHADLPLFMLH